MAKRNLGDLDWDRSLDYEFDDPFGPVSQQKKRGVISRVATSFAQGAKESLMSPATLRSLTSNMLPKGYGSALDLAEEVQRRGEELHNIARKEWEPSIPVMRRLTQRHLTKTKKFLPKSTYDRLEEFSKPKTYGRLPTKAELQDQDITRQEAEIFGLQMETNAKQEAENRAERALQHAQLMKASRQQIHSADIQQQGIMRLVDYQDEITNKYQRRSLELKTRHYLVARDSLHLQIETAKRVDAKLEALVTNTAMPDIAKQDLRHTATQSFRNKLLGGLQDSAGKWASNYIGGVVKRAGGSIRELMGGSEAALSMLDGDSEMPWQEMLMKMAGGAAAQGATRFVGGRLAPVLAKRFPGLAQGGGVLGRGVGSLPLLLNRYAKSSTKRDGTAGIMEDLLKSVLGKYEMNTVVGRHGLASLDQPAAWNKLSQRSLVEIIPGLLSRIEHNTARVFDPKAKRQVFSHDTGKFMSVSAASKVTVQKVFAPDKRASVKQNVNQFIDDLIGKEPITAATRKAFLRQTLLDSGNGEPFDPDRYTSAASSTPELDARAKNELAEIFKRTGVLSDGRRDQAWLADRSEQFNKIDFGAHVPTSASSVYRSTGGRELLKAQNLIKTDKDKDVLNMSKILDMVEQADYGDIKVKELTPAERLREAAKGKLSRFTNDVGDLYLQGGAKAVLEAGKLKAGAYRDAVSGRVITQWADIQGPIRDLTTNEIVMDLTQLSMGLYDSKGKKIAFSLRSMASGAFDWSGEQITKAKKSAGPKINELKDIVNARGDVLLSGWKLKAGQYRDSLTKKVLLKVEDISGPVIDENGNTVVTASDVAAILTERGGRRLDDAVTRMRDRTNAMLSQAASSPGSMFGQAKTDAQATDGLGAMHEPGASADSGELVRLGTEQVELLKVIAQILAAQGPNGNGQDPTFRRGFLDSIAIGGVKGAWAGLKGAAKGSWWWSKKVIGGTFGGIGLAGRGAGAIVQGGAHRIGNLVRGIKDIYVQGKRSPVMIAQRIKMGHYKDVNTKKKITRWTDVTGPVIDVTTGETVLDQDDFEKGIYVKGPAGLVRLASKSLMNFGGAVVSFYGNVAALPFRAASMLVKGAGATLKWATNKQVDVYVKGESSPRLQASKMKLGRYYNVSPKKMGVVVRTYEDIYGEIKELQQGAYKAQADDKTVLYEDEIHNPGLCGRWGVSLRTPLSRLIGAVGGAAVSVIKGAGALFGGAMKGYGKLFGGMLGLGGGLLGAPFKFLGSLLNPFEKHGAKQVEWLEKIYNLLDTRMPSPGPRKGSWQEQFLSREEKEKNKDEEKKRDEKDRKWGMGGLLSFFKDKAKGFMGFGANEEEEEDDDDGDTTIIATGGGEDGKDGKKPRKPTPGEKGSRRRNRQAKKLKAERKRRGKKGFLRGGLRSLMNPKALLAGALLSGGTGMAMDALGADEDSTTGKVVNGVGDAAGTVANVAFLAQLARAVPWIGGLLGGGAAATAATGAAATGAAAAGTTAAAAGGTAALAGGTAAAAGGVSTAAAVGTGAAAVGGTAAGVLGAPVWVPVAAVAAVGGAGIYYGHKQAKYGKLTPVRRFRYLQYGVGPGDAANNKKIFLLEDLLLDHVGVVNGGLEVVAKSNSGEKDITMKEVYELMDMEDGWFSDNKQQRQVFNMWYAQRFKPIFLTWVKTLRDLEPTMSLLEADDKLAGEKQAKLVKKAWTISRSVYAMSAGPFEGEPAITDYGQIEDAYNLALKEAGKTSGEKSLDKWKARSQSVMSVIPGIGSISNYVNNQVDEYKAQKEGAALTAKAMEANAGMGMLATTGGVVKNTKGVEDLLTSPLSRLGKITALTAIRYRAYGLSDLDLDRVRALAALETFVFRKVSIASSGNAYFPLDGEQAYMAACGLFGLTANTPQDRLRWCSWFGRRFLPVCLAYIKAVKAASPSADLQSPERMLKADKLMEIGQQMLNTKDPDGRSIWFATLSPWSAQEKLNSDSNAISGSMLALKATADKKVMAEDKPPGQDAAVKQNKGMLGTMMDQMRTGTQSASDWLLGDQKNRNWLGRQVDKAQQGTQAFFDNSSEAVDQLRRGNYTGAAVAAANASTAPLRYMTGISPPPEPKIVGTAKERESLLVQEAIKAGITDPRELAMLLGQVAAETGSFKIVSENLKYRPEQARKTWPKRFPSVEYARQVLAQGPVAFADVIYNGRMGNTQPGDGYKYRGRGLIQLTGKENYAAFQRATGIKVLENPDIVATDPKVSVLAALHYWKTRVRGKAQVDDLKAVTRRINGGQNGLEHRRAGYNRYLAKLSGKTVEQILAEYSSGIKSGNAASETTAKARSTVAATPVTTTTTANGSGGGVGAVQKAQTPPWIGTAVATAAGSTGTNSLTTGGGYAGMLAGKGPTIAPVAAVATAAPSINSTASLEAAAAMSAKDEASRMASREKERQAREQQTRAVEAQSQRQSQTDQAQMVRVGDILEKSQVHLQKIEKNTMDTVSILRDLLRQGGRSTETADATPAEKIETATTRRTARPVQAGQDRLPVDMRFSAPIG